jgi:O-acetylserine/cysteine efflux transporter
MLTLSIHSGLSAGVSSLILQSSAFISVLLGVIFLKEKLNMTRKIGLLISVLGLLLIFTLQDGSITLVGSFLACCAAISFSVIGLIIKKVNINDMFSFVVWSCAFAPLPLFILSLLVNGTSGFNTLVDHINYYSVFSVLFQAYPVTVLGYWLWNKLLTQYPMSTMAPITLLIPIFGLLGSMIFYNEPLGFTKLLASLLIIFGVFIGLSDRLIQKIRMKII